MTDDFDRAVSVLRNAIEAGADDAAVRRVVTLVAEHVLPIWEAGRPNDKNVRHAVNAMKFAATAPQTDAVISMVADAAFDAGEQAYSFGVNVTDRERILSRSAEVVMHAARACASRNGCLGFAAAALLNAEMAVAANAKHAVFSAAKPGVPQCADLDGASAAAVDALVAVVRRGLEPADGAAP